MVHQNPLRFHHVMHACGNLGTRGLEGVQIWLPTILAIFYPPLKQIWGCVWLFLQAQKGNNYFTELAERVEYGNYAYTTGIRPVLFDGHLRRMARARLCAWALGGPLYKLYHSMLYHMYMLYYRCHSRYVILYHIISYHIISYYTILCYIMLYCIIVQYSTVQCSIVQTVQYTGSWHGRCRMRTPRSLAQTRARRSSARCTRRQGIVLKHRNSLQKSLCPVVMCPYLCSSDYLFVTLYTPFAF